MYLRAVSLTRRRCYWIALVGALVVTAAATSPNLTPAVGRLAGQLARPSSRAHMARSLSMNETAQLRVLSRRGIIFNEQGPASGTFRCTLTLRLTAKVTHVSIQFSANPSGGTLRGEGSANVQPEGAIGRVTGTVSITGGSGRYAHAHGSRLAITGTVNRHNYNLSIRVTGTMYY